ncbi:MAG: hypothetical protein ACUVTP_07915 [Candidatus Fervidibacter sp.]|uniref:hypothetical protein n=1 Tax=Candidatus Fervidibacter sp. TaxID=3100871 RepID=UPI00404B5160
MFFGELSSKGALAHPLHRDLPRLQTPLKVLRQKLMEVTGDVCARVGHGICTLVIGRFGNHSVPVKGRSP